MEELKLGLDSAMAGISSSTGGGGEYEMDYIDDKNVKNIFKPSDEIDFWIKVFNASTSK
jgi:hypothetical protein